MVFYFFVAFNYDEHMLDRSHRIRATEFPDFRAPGTMFTGSALRIKFIRGNPPARIAAIAGKKHYRTNVERNRFRREVYAALQSHLGVLDARGGVLLVSPMKKVHEITWANIVDDIRAYIAK